VENTEKQRGKSKRHANTVNAFHPKRTFFLVDTETCRHLNPASASCEVDALSAGQEIIAFYGTRNFIILPTRDRHWILSRGG
jgi:hypothetical protein